MPKLKCPCCNKRVIDLPDKDLKNNCKLVRTKEIVDSDIILKCLHCGNLIGFRLTLYEKINSMECIPILK